MAIIEGGNMQIKLNSSTVTLSPASVIAVQDGAGSRVLCRSGILWVTQEGELKDSIVRAGDVLTLHKPGRTVIGALEAASLTLMDPEPAKPKRLRDQSPVRRAERIAVACE
jgi:hypothetical protein